MSSLLEEILIRREVARLGREIAVLEEELRELEEALKLVEEGRARSIYRVFGSFVAIELDPSRARELIEDRIALVRSALAGLRKRVEELESRLRSLNSSS